MVNDALVNIRSFIVHKSLFSDHFLGRNLETLDDQIRFFFFLDFSRAAPMAYGDSQARGRIRAVAAGLHHSHSNMGSEPRLQPTPQLMAMSDS